MEAVHAALRNPQRALIELDRIEARESFWNFVKMAWPVIEPASPLVEGWAIRAMANALQAVAEKKIRKLCMNVPPGLSKSMLTSVLFPAWRWGPYGQPWWRNISASYDITLATRDLVRCRDLVLSDWYQERWPIGGFKVDQDQKTYYQNEHTGWRYGTSVAGGVTGHRGHCFTIDDPHSVKSAESEVSRLREKTWISHTVPTRFIDQANPEMVLIMQRLHVGDMTGILLENFADEWTFMILPMEYEPDRHCSIPEIGFEDPRTEPHELLFPERFPRHAVDSLKRALSLEGGEYAVAGQLQQRPIPRDGGLFPLKYAQYAEDKPYPGRVVRGWDLAASTTDRSAFTAGVKLRMTPDRRIIVEDVRRFRDSSFGVEEKIKATAQKDGVVCPISIPQDPGQAGKSQKAHYAQKLHGYRVHFSLESGEKEVRALGIAAQWEAGNVWLRKGPWNKDFLDELAGLTTFKDQIDALSRAYAYLLQQIESDDVGTTPGILVE